MKQILLGMALVGLAFGCKTDKQAAISDASTAPSADCCATKAACSDAEKAECAEKKAECAKVCPMTGKVSE